MYPAEGEFLAAARELADAQGALLVYDEVQCGLGRTGSFFAWESAGVRPHAVTMAKGLANGLPIGCLLVADDAPRGFEPGDHASTFGGNLVACAAANAVVDAIDEALLANVRERSAQLRAGLEALPGVVEVRGGGLLLAAELERPAAEVVAGAFERGLLVLTAGERVLRLTPPLNVSAEECEQALATLREACAN